jgi:hypothetical protein
MKSLELRLRYEELVEVNEAMVAQVSSGQREADESDLKLLKRGAAMNKLQRILRLMSTGAVHATCTVPACIACVLYTCAVDTHAGCCRGLVSRWRRATVASQKQQQLSLQHDLLDSETSFLKDQIRALRLAASSNGQERQITSLSALIGAGRRRDEGTVVCFV